MTANCSIISALLSLQESLLHQSLLRQFLLEQLLLEQLLGLPGS